MRLFVTGTDTDVGKTRVTAAVARALAQRGLRPTIVKVAQTGLADGEPGDAALAGSLAGCRALELARFPLANDPWSAAVAAGVEPLEASALCAQLAALGRPLVIEGSGGIAVPLNARETFADFAARARCDAILAIGLRIGCINHALLTLAYLAHHAVPVRGAVLVERFGATDDAYRNQVRRALDAHVALLGDVPFDPDVSRSVAAAATLFHPL